MFGYPSHFYFDAWCGPLFYIMEGYQVIFLIDNFLRQESKYFILAMHTFVDEFVRLMPCYHP